MAQSTATKKLYRSYHSRSFRKGQQKYTEPVTRMIKFVQKSHQNILDSIEKLKKRYKKIVEVHTKMVSGMYNGYLIVELK